MAGKEVPSLSAAQWVQRLQRRMGADFPVLHASLELTERCNLRCVHCYINRPAGDGEARQGELAADEWKSLLEQMARAGVLTLLVTGGEPLLRPDFAEIYLYAKRSGFHVSLFTNGTLLTPELADLFVEYPPWQVEITLYGATAETYEGITGVTGSYARCLQAIDLLRQRGLALALKTVVLRPNAHEVLAMRRLADGWGAGFRYDPMIQSRLDGDGRPLAYRLSPEDIVALERSDPKRMQLLQEFCAGPWSAPDRRYLFTCGAGQGTFHLDPYGHLHPCTMARWLCYDLKTGSLQEALREFIPAVRRMSAPENGPCWECDLQILCQNCPAWAKRETGYPEAAEPFRCQLAHLRSQGLALVVRMVEEAGPVARSTSRCTCSSSEEDSDE